MVTQLVRLENKLSELLDKKAHFYCKLTTDTCFQCIDVCNRIIHCSSDDLCQPLASCSLRQSADVTFSHYNFVLLFGLPLLKWLTRA